MRSSVTFLLLTVCVVAALGERVASAQTQPASSYSFSGLTAGLRKPNPFSGYFADDFALSYANQNNSNVIVKTRLVANDPNFQFQPCAQRGTYAYADLTIGPRDSASLNVLGTSVLASGPEFTGTLTAEALGGQLTFYIFPPTDFKVSTSTQQSTQCLAYYKAWQEGSWTVPFFWDGVAQLLISPYGNYWNNDHFWDKGWNSSLTIINNGSQTVTYTINYDKNSSANAVSHNPASGCAATTLNQVTTQTIPPGGSWSGTLKGIFNPNPSHMVAEDGFFYVVDDPPIPGTNPSQSLSANPSGTSTVCGASCPLIFSCQ